MSAAFVTAQEQQQVQIFGTILPGKYDSQIFLYPMLQIIMFLTSLKMQPGIYVISDPFFQHNKFSKYRQ